MRFSDLAERFHYNASYLSCTMKKYTCYAFHDIPRLYRLDEVLAG